MTCLSAIMIITNQEKTPAAPNIMHSPLDFYNMSIVVDCLISPLLQILTLIWSELKRNEQCKGRPTVRQESPGSRVPSPQPSPSDTLNALEGQSVLVLPVLCWPIHLPQLQIRQIWHELPLMNRQNQSDNYTSYSQMRTSMQLYLDNRITCKYSF